MPDNNAGKHAAAGAVSFDRQTLAAMLQAISSCEVLVVGDFMVDRTIYGEAARISPEAPTPVVTVLETAWQLGGAGNVVRSVDSLGGKAWCAAVTGEDETGSLLEEQLRAACESLLVVREPGRKTTLKSRVVAAQGGRQRGGRHGHQQILRFDEETCHPISADSAARVLAFAAEAMGRVQGVVISDYAKGALPPDLLREIMALARRHRKPLIVDPKGRDFERYRGATALTPNAAEAEAALGVSFSAPHPASLDDAGWERRLQERLDGLELGALLVTRGAEGLSLIDRQGFHHFPTSAREVFDVTGAGDTVLAAFSLAMASGASLAEAAQLGNLAAGVVVGKAGAAVAFPFEVEQGLDARRLSSAGKIRSRSEIGTLAEALRRDRRRIVFTNGCFDLLHAGHMYLLREAKALGEVLIVGLNSDASVGRLKGDGRPIVPAGERAEALAALECVDFLVVFEEPDPLELLRVIRPDVLVKGDDYSESEVVGAEFLKSYGGETRLIPVRPGFSTSRLVEKIRSPAS